MTALYTDQSSVTVLDGDGRDLLTNTADAAFAACPYRYSVLYEQGVRKAEPSTALRFGTHVHECLDMHAKGRAWDEILIYIENAYAWTGDRNLSLEREILTRLVEGYIVRWMGDKLEIVASELPFVVQVAGAERAGKIDKIVKLEDGRLAVVDHKTTEYDISAGAAYWDRMRLDTQVSLYIIAARKLGFEIEAFLLDAIRKPMIAPRRLYKEDRIGLETVGRYFDREFPDYLRPLDIGDHRVPCAVPDAETIELFGARLTADLQTRATFYFQRREIVRSEDDLRAYEQDAMFRAMDIANTRARNHWWKNAQACNEPYPCECRSLCFNGVDVAKEPLPHGFVRLDYVHPELKGGKK